jgi:hypothetical protein
LDDRERSFAKGPADVVRGWAGALGEAGVQRGIWVEHPELDESALGLLRATLPQLALVTAAGRTARDVADDVAKADDAAAL